MPAPWRPGRTLPTPTPSAPSSRGWRRSRRSTSTRSTTTLRDPRRRARPPGRARWRTRSGWRRWSPGSASRRCCRAPASGDGYIHRFLTVWTPDEQGHALALERLLVALDIEPFPLPQDEPVPVHNRLAGLLGTMSARMHETVELVYHSIGAMNERLGLLRLRADVGDPHRARRARPGRHADEAAPPRRVRPPRLLPHRRPRPPRPARPLAARRRPQRDHPHLLAGRRRRRQGQAGLRRHPPLPRRQPRHRRPRPAPRRVPPQRRRAQAPPLRAASFDRCSSSVA